MTRAAPDDEAEPAGSGEKSRPRQAVVVVHGMGEQKPMSTLRGFVDAVWTRNATLATHRPDGGAWVSPPRIWIVPDPITGSHEQRRITTSKDANGRRTDFFELYWADLTQGTSRGRLYAWMSSLLLRKPADIPADARRLYGATLLFAIVMALAALLLAFSFWKAWFPAGAVLLAIGASGLFWAFDHFVVPYFGDVATYVQAEAGTVEKRALVRERGLGLMRRLMDDPTYDRIILASHSLGSVIAYDLLQILWAERRPQNLLFQRDKSLWQAIRQVEKYAQLPDAPPQAMTPQERAEFRKAQWRLYEETRALDARLGNGWKISDFVSVGSPLTHAEFLVTHNVAAWREGVAERRFSICPPIADTATHPLLYESGRDDETDKPLHSVHHGALFAATRWTNIFDLGDTLFTGDPISGSMQENFGSGVEEIQVEIRRPRLGRLFTHTAYWSLDARGKIVTPAPGLDLPDSRGLLPEETGHIRALQAAIDLAQET